jgi:hypothetical protein
LDDHLDRDALGDFSIGDIVFIRRQDMYNLDIDTELAEQMGFLDPGDVG